MCIVNLGTGGIAWRRTRYDDSRFGTRPRHSVGAGQSSDERCRSLTSISRAWHPVTPNRKIWRQLRLTEIYALRSIVMVLGIYRRISGNVHWPRKNFVIQNWSKQNVKMLRESARKKSSVINQSTDLHCDFFFVISEFSARSFARCQCLQRLPPGEECPSIAKSKDNLMMEHIMWKSFFAAHHRRRTISSWSSTRSGHSQCWIANETLNDIDKPNFDVLFIFLLTDFNCLADHTERHRI